MGSRVSSKRPVEETKFLERRNLLLGLEGCYCTEVFAVQSWFGDLSM